MPDRFLLLVTIRSSETSGASRYSWTRKKQAVVEEMAPYPLITFIIGCVIIHMMSIVGNIRLGVNVPFQVLEKRAARMTNTGDTISTIITMGNERTKNELVTAL